MKNGKIKEQPEEFSLLASSEKENLSEALGQGAKASTSISVEEVRRSRPLFAREKNTFFSSKNEKLGSDSAKPIAVLKKT